MHDGSDCFSRGVHTRIMRKPFVIFQWGVLSTLYPPIMMVGHSLIMDARGYKKTVYHQYLEQDSHSEPCINNLTEPYIVLPLLKRCCFRRAKRSN